MFRVHERVYIGNDINTSPSIGTVNYRSDGKFEIIDIEGRLFANGDVITGEDSGFSNVLVDFIYSTRVGSGEPWDLTYTLIADDYSEGFDEDGDPLGFGEELIVMDWSITGKKSDDWQKDGMIVVDDVPYVAPPLYQINTSNTVMQNGDYIVINQWFVNGANTDPANIYQYLVVV